MNFIALSALAFALITLPVNAIEWSSAQSSAAKPATLYDCSQIGNEIRITLMLITMLTLP
jgi:hypothetical protein